MSIITRYYYPMSIEDERERHNKVIQLVRDAIQNDSQLREQYQVGDKFRFVRDRLTNLLSHLESHPITAVTKEDVGAAAETQNDLLVYVYLYNAQGAVLRSWSSMLMPKIFYEHSVNRPIYSDKTHIENVLRSKANRQQHAYLTISVKSDDIVSTAHLTDALGNPLVKVREGKLDFKKLVSFTHNDQDYMLDARGELVKKPLR
jgi:hypothetical protein